jgi:glycosyltransferase involved in cell wall biosynthesis
MAALAPDVVVADDTRWAAMSAFGPGRLRIVHTHNMESRLWGAWSDRHPEDRNLASEARRYARLERELLRPAHQVWAVQEHERQAYISNGLDPARVFLAPNVVPDASFLAGPQPGEPGLGVFFGSLWYEPNADAALYLAGLARRWDGRHADTRLVLAGRGADAALRAAAETIPGLALPGFVPDLGALLRRAAAVLIPLAWGGGTKLKTIEAMAAGKPILTTPEGAEGLDLEDGVHAVIRDLGPGFDDMALAMLREPERFADLGVKAQTLARARFSQASLDRAVARAVTDGLGALQAGLGARA